MSETLTKLRPDRDLQCYFLQPSAVAALSGASATGFTVSGSWRQQFDWAVLEWNRDNVFEHPALRNLPDGDLSGITLSYQESRTNSIPIDSTLYPTVDWPYLRIWSDSISSAGVLTETIYHVPLKNYATAVAGSYVPPTAQLTLQGTATAGDYIELSWLDQHFNHLMAPGDTLESAVNSLAYAITSNQTLGLVTATASGAQITLTYIGTNSGANGNRIGVYGMVHNDHGAPTESWSPAFVLFSGGQSPTKWQVDLNFANLADSNGSAIPVSAMQSVRKLRWTWSADEQNANYARGEFAVAVTNWTVSGTNLVYKVAGPGSRRAEDSAAQIVYSGSGWSNGIGNFSGGSIHWTTKPGDTLTYVYEASAAHSLYLGTRCSDGCALATVQVDGGAPILVPTALTGEDVLSRKLLGQFSANTIHTVIVTHAGTAGQYFYFDFFEIALPTSALPSYTNTLATTLATDWDTLHSQALPPERTAWFLSKLGFPARANHYAGALWFYELAPSGYQYATGTVTFSGAPAFGNTTSISLGLTTVSKTNFVGDTPATIATAFALLLNAGSSGVWASATGATLTVTAKAIGTAGNSLALSATTNDSQFTARYTGLSGGKDGIWITDLTALPRLNRAARDWHSAYFAALKGYGIVPTVAFSMELGNGDDSPTAAIAQCYPGGVAAWLNTPSLQTNFGPQSTGYWKQVYLDMATLMANAGVTPYLQFGEVQWWYYAGGTAPNLGMPFYDAYTTSAFQSRYGTAMKTISSENADPTLYPNECAFLPGLIGAFTNAVIAFVKASYPTAKFEVLYPHDVNNTPLNKIINFPTAAWTPSALACMKTENFIYTGDRNLDLARVSIDFCDSMGFPPAQSSHLVGIMDYTTAWGKERALAIAAGDESVVLFALDQFCLIGYGVPVTSGRGQARYIAV